MREQFFEKPILNSPYEYPKKHWELDKDGQPTQKVAETRRRAEFITPIPKPKKKSIVARIDKLISAVKFAREQANGIEAKEQRVGGKVLGYLFRE